MPLSLIQESHKLLILAVHTRILKIPPAGVLKTVSHQRISQRAVKTSLMKQLNPRGPIAS